MTAAITVTVNDKAILTALANARKASASPSTYLGPIGVLLKESTRLRFVDGKSPTGGKWKPVLRGGQPLRNTGVHLANAVNTRLDAKSVTVGVPYAWAAIHQYGATINAKSALGLRFKVGNRWVRKMSVKIPARPFLGISTEDRADILALLAKVLTPA